MSEISLSELTQFCLSYYPTSTAVYTMYNRMWACPIKKGFLGQLHISTLEFFPGFGIKLDSPMPCHWKNSKDFQQRPVFGKIVPFRGYE